MSAVRCRQPDAMQLFLYKNLLRKKKPLSSRYASSLVSVVCTVVHCVDILQQREEVIYNIEKEAKHQQWPLKHSASFIIIIINVTASHSSSFHMPMYVKENSTNQKYSFLFFLSFFFSSVLLQAL